MTFNDKRLKKIRKSLRRNQTAAERKIWSLVRNRQVNGFKFYRQYSVGKYVLDFYCPEVRLAIELDGGQHAEAKLKARDAERSKDLKTRNIRVIRFWDNEVFENPEGVYEVILGEINNSSPPSS